MIITVKDKNYTVINTLTLGEHRKINGLNAKLNRLSNQIKESNDETKTQTLQSELMMVGDEQLETICEFLEKHIQGIKQEDLNLMSLDEAILVFQEVYKSLSTVDKELKKTSN